MIRLLFFLLFPILLFSQTNQNSNGLEVDFLRGNVQPHAADLLQLAGHPEAIMLSFSKQTNGNQEWHKAYNYPDFGGYFLYQDFKNSFLGKNYAIGAHYNFYFFKRNFHFKIAQGIAYTTNPYDKINNSKNKAFGTKFMGNVNLGLYFKKENIIDNFGLHAGLLFTHYSNGRFKSPNSGINTLLFNVGVNYNFDDKNKRTVDSTLVKTKITEPIKYNFVFRTGLNESSVIGSGQHPFYHIGFYADKRINRKSALQLGSEIFLTQSFKDYIKYRSVAFQEFYTDPNTDYKRIGVFVGHELIINKISLIAQVGHYVYDPLKNEISIYDRIGMNYHITSKIFTSFTLKTHLFLAEAIEFGVGIRL